MLRAEGLVNDAEFARHYTRTRAAAKRLGPARLQADLRRLGVDEQVAAEAVRETLEREHIEPGQLLREAATRKLREMAGLDRAAQRRRLKAFLMRRGFPSGEIVAVLRETLRLTLPSLDFPHGRRLRHPARYRRGRRVVAPVCLCALQGAGAVGYGGAARAGCG